MPKVSRLDAAHAPDRLAALATPALVVDRPRLLANIARMEARARELGVRLRPHLKTAKSIEVARAIPSATGYGITVSTVKEVEYFAAHGVPDLLYAVTVTPDRVPRLAHATRGGTVVRLAADDAAVVAEVAAAAAAADARFPVLVEIDSGEHRSGLAPDDDALLDVARAIERAPALQLDGVFTHAGHSYGCRSIDAIRSIAEQERAAVVHAKERLIAAGLPCGITSVGSTPTATHAAHLDGVTELRAGVYVFQDLFQAAIGSCTLDDLAATVLTTVIGQQRRHGRVLVDAGGLALSKDRSTASLGAAGDCGYGLVADVSGRHLIDEVRVVEVFQEHGVLAGTGLDFDALPVGSRLRILPNHACMTASAYDRYHVVDGDCVVEAWPRIHEWS